MHIILSSILINLHLCNHKNTDNLNIQLNNQLKQAATRIVYASILNLLLIKSTEMVKGL